MIARLIQRLANAEATPPPWGLRAAIITVLVAVLAVIVGTVIALALFPAAPYALLVGWTLGGVVTIIYVLSNFREDREALRTGPTSARLALVLLFSIGMALLIDTLSLIVTQRFFASLELMSLFGFEPGLAGWLVAVVFMLLVQPVSEELVFRGVFFPAARQALGGWGGWLASGLLYGLFHAFIYTATDNLWHILIAPVVAGLVLSAIRAYTQSTRAAIVAHMGFGLFALLRLLAVPL